VLNVISSRKALSPLAIGLIVLGVATVLVAGVVVFYFWSGAGNVITETKQFSDFNKLDISSGFEVTITQSSTYRVVITANEKALDLIQVTQSDNTLTIQIQPGAAFSASTLKAEIAMPVLDGVMFSGGIRATASGFNTTEDFRADLTGGSSFDITDFTAKNLNVELSGGSTLTAQGTGNNLVAIGSGGSNLDLSNLQINDAHIDLSGASHAIVNLDGTLNVTASGASSVEYMGSPTLGNIDTSGGSTVSKR
jgi:hypothetical protein